MVELHDEDICRVKADIERQKKMCAELERACKNMVSEIWQQATKIDALMLEADKPLTNGALKKENMTLKEENERLKQVLADCEKKRVDEKNGRIIDMTKPQPCVRWLDARAQDKEERLVFCLKKLAEEYEEVWEAYGEYVSHNSGAREHLAEELTDAITAAATMLCALGYNEVARSDVQKQVNRKNRARGYWG